MRDDKHTEEMTMNLEATARQYFSTFESKNLEGLSAMFTPTVSLRDWNICVTGHAAVLQANADIFENVGDITVSVQNLYCDGLTVIAQLMIFIDGANALPVVDIIQFNPASKIESIVAYRGN